MITRFSRNQLGRLCLKGREIEDGPWHHEPDQLEFWHADVLCRLARGPQGAWCGYVAIPDNHPWRHGHYPDPTVHGGLTYAGDSTNVPENGVVFGPSPGVLWVGFDCAHSGTHYDLVLNTREVHHHIYRDLAFARREVERLAEQCARAVSPPSRGVKIQPERLLLVRYFDKECCERRVVALACGYTVVTGTDGFPRVGVEIVIDPRASDHHLACSLSTTQLHRLVIPPRDLLGVRPFRQGDVTDTPEPATPETP